MVYDIRISPTFCEQYSLKTMKRIKVSVFYHECRDWVIYVHLSYDVASGSDITPCDKIDKPLVVYRFSGNVMTSITTLRT